MLYFKLTMKRRKFIRNSSWALAAMMQSHVLLASHAPSLPIQSSAVPLIKALHLQTICDLKVLQKFYEEKMGLRVVVMSASTLSIQAGLSVINFTKINSKLRPFYHFAFNIPENKIKEAFEWQRQRTPVVHPNPDSPKDQVVNFPHWNAHSVFFLDPAGNLLEYIARHDLKNAASGKFGTEDIQYVSEIGLIVDDVKEAGSSLQSALSVESYRKMEEGFWPLGSEAGLLLLIKTGRVWTSNPNEINKVGVFDTVVELNRPVPDWKSDRYPYRILSKDK